MYIAEPWHIQAYAFYAKSPVSQDVSFAFLIASGAEEGGREAENTST